MAEIQNIIELTFTEADGSAFAASALESANNAAESATNAFRYASTASDSADASAESARLSNQFAVNAYDRASAALRAKEGAETAAQQAETSATNASTYEQNAFANAQDAQFQANRAATASQTAVRNASDAAGYAANASSAANNASNSATSAASSATQATSAKDTVVASVTEAAGYASSADSSATQAAQSASTAQTQAQNAMTHASNAQTFANNAQTSATQAAASATTANDSANLAVEVAESIPSDYTTLSNDVDDLKSALTEKLVLVYSENKWNPQNTKSGYMVAAGTEGANASYEHLIEPIPVTEGDVVRSYEIAAGGGFVVAGMRWFCAMDSDKNAVASAGSNANITSYTVPSGIAYVNPTMNISGQKRMITINLDATSFIDYFDPYYVATPEFTGIIDINSGTNFDTEFMDYSMINLLDPSECELGKFLNAITGAISDNASYYVTDYIPIKEGYTLYFYEQDNKALINARSIGAYDSEKVLLDALGTNTGGNHYTQTGRVAFVRLCFAYSSSDIVRTPYGISVMANSNPQFATGYGGDAVIKKEYIRKVINVTASDTATQVISKFVEAFETGNCDMVFECSTYALGDIPATVKDDYHLYENEIPIGNGCRYFFNGATLTANIDLTTHTPSAGDDTFICNFLGTQKRPSDFEMHDGILIATDTIYVVHDESAAKESTYKHLYQNMEMHYNTSLRTDAIRKCIGGGTGKYGVVEIIGCKFVTDGVSECVSFHGNGTDIVGAKFDLNIRNSWLSNGLRVNQMSANQTARVFYASNSAAASPVIGDRVTLTDLCNEIRS